MKIKSIAAFALLAFVIGSVVFLVAKESRRPPAGGASSTGAGGSSGSPGDGMKGASGGAVQGHKVIAYYFHGKYRCASCVKIEALSRKTITEGFAEDLASGRVEFRDVDVDLPQNRHFIEEYRLSSQSLIIVEVRDGRQIRWRNLEKVWTLLDSEQEFVSYVRDGVSGFLNRA